MVATRKRPKIGLYIGLLIVIIVVILVFGVGKYNVTVKSGENTVLSALRIEYGLS